MVASTNLIQIKRSNAVAKPSTLNVGELAWSNVTSKLYIGAYGSVTAIGGVQNPGVLTANQALVANSTGGIDYVITSNLVTTSITAGDGYYNPNTQIAASNKGYILSVDGNGSTFWRDANTLSVSPKYVQNTDSRTLSGNLYFTGANVTIDNLFIGSGILSGNGSGLTSVNAIALGGQSLLNIYDTANSYAYDAAAAAFANSVTRSNAAYANAYAKATSYADTAAGTAYANAYNKATSYADTVAGTAYANAVSYADTAAGTAYANAYNKATSYADTQAGNAFANAYNKATSYADTIAGTAYSNATAWAYNNLVRSVSAGDNSITVGGTSNAPSVAVKIASGNGVYFGTDGLYIGQDVKTTSNVTFNVGNFTSIISNTSIVGNTATIYHNLVVGGDILVTGNIVSSNIESIQVSDPLLHLGTNNHVSDTLDIGFFADYYDGVNVQYTGLVRDASDKIYKLFHHLDKDPNPLVNFSATTTATLQAYLISGGLLSNNTVLSLTANNTLAVGITANTLSLTTALGYTSGGTGFNSYSDGDLLVGSTSTGLTKLSAGSTNGYVLQTNGSGTLSWGSIDGGTFS
jgi:hypothetical protein